MGGRPAQPRDNQRILRRSSEGAPKVCDPRILRAGSWQANSAAMPPSPEESVDFLCKKFTHLIDQLRSADEEKEQALASLDATQAQLSELKRSSDVHHFGRSGVSDLHRHIGMLGDMQSRYSFSGPSSVLRS